MKRTADRMVAHEWAFPLGIEEPRENMEQITEHLAGITPRAPVIVADNVAVYLTDKNPAICLEDYPSLAPPWACYWIEYRSSSGRQRRGVWIEDITEQSDVALVDPLPDDAMHIPQLGAAARADAHANGATDEDIRWVVAHSLMVEQDGRVWGPAGIVTLALDHSGQVIGNRWSAAPVTTLFDKAAGAVDLPRPVDPDLPEMPTLEDFAAMSDEERRTAIHDAREQLGVLDGHVHALEARAETLRESADTIGFLTSFADDNDPSVWLIRAVAPALQTVAFLHCRNVALDRVDPPEKVQTKRRRSGRPPLVRYHTLRLDLPRPSNSGHGGSGRHARSLHIVAGHFAHYGACCPNHEPRGLLFGRLTGVYFVATHARGNSGVGETRTDYEVRDVQEVSS